MKLMPNPQNCQPVKGFFPESAKDIEDRFVFVSLDADLYEPYTMDYCTSIHG